MPRQLSLLAASALAPVVDDLDGLLCGPAHVVRGGGAHAGSARISVLVTEQWRASVLLARLKLLALTDDAVPAARSAGSPGSLSVRTRFDPRLLPLASRWTRGASTAAPPGLFLDGSRLWWWAVAAGVADSQISGGGYLLRLAPKAPQLWPAVGAALAGAGLAGVFVGPRADGPAYRLVGSRRLARLAELLGEPPTGAPPTAWPTG